MNFFLREARGSRHLGEALVHHDLLQVEVRREGKHRQPREQHCLATLEKNHLLRSNKSWSLPEITPDCLVPVETVISRYGLHV